MAVFGRTLPRANRLGLHRRPQVLSTESVGHSHLRERAPREKPDYLCRHRWRDGAGIRKKVTPFPFTVLNSTDGLRRYQRSSPKNGSAVRPFRVGFSPGSETAAETGARNSPGDRAPRSRRSGPSTGRATRTRTPGVFQDPFSTGGHGREDLREAGTLFFEARAHVDEGCASERVFSRADTTRVTTGIGDRR